jgi:transposase-like protein
MNTMPLFDFMKKFHDNDSCLRYLSERKWANGYKCLKCNKEDSIKGNTAYSLRCKHCKYDESPTAHTVFHNVKFPLPKAFLICYRITSKIGASSCEIAKEAGICQKTAWFFCAKLREVMKSSDKYPLKGEVHVDEAVIGGAEEGKPGRSLGEKAPVLIMIEKVDEGKIGRIYVEKISNYQKVTIYPILERKIDADAIVVTDMYPTYINLDSLFDEAKMLKSEKGKNFPEIHIQIMNLKSGLRGVHRQCSSKYLDGYLNQYCYRTNRRNMKKPIVLNLIDKIVTGKYVSFNELKLRAA